MTDLAQGGAFAAQETHAKGVKRGHGRDITRFAWDQRTDAFAHFPRSFIGESDGQQSPSGNPMSRNQMGNPVRDDPGFTAACASQNEQGTLRMLHGLALAGVESVKEVHRLIVAWGTFTESI